MADIRFNCPQCGDKLAVDEKGAGLRVSCPVCKATITIPNMAHPPPPVKPSAVPATASPSHMVKSLREVEAQVTRTHDPKAIRAEFDELHERLSKEKSTRLPASGDIYMALGMVMEQAHMEVSKTMMAKYKLTEDEMQKILYPNA